MNIPKPEGLLSVVLPVELQPSSSSQQLFTNQDQQDEEASDCPLLTPSPPASNLHTTKNAAPVFKPLETTPIEIPTTPTLDNINTEDGLNVFINIVNSSSKPLHDEPSSRDPMVETSSSGSSSDTNEPVCTQLLTQLNEAYQHLAPDAQALFYNQESGGKPPLVGIQLVVPKPPKDYRFTKWNWPLIRKTCFWTLMSLLAGCTALVIGIIATMPRKCDPRVEWWQGSVFYEIFPASFQDSSKGGDGIGDLRGITMRLDYLQKLGVRGIRLNSIFPAPHYPEYYANITSLTELNSQLGTLEDFATLIRETHRRNMSLILDLPLHPFVKSLPSEVRPSTKPNKTDKAVRERRGATEDSVLQGVVASMAEKPSIHATNDALASVLTGPGLEGEGEGEGGWTLTTTRSSPVKSSSSSPGTGHEDVTTTSTSKSPAMQAIKQTLSSLDSGQSVEIDEKSILTSSTLRTPSTSTTDTKPKYEAHSSNHIDEKIGHPVSQAIQTWVNRGVDGFYLKGLEHYVDEGSFAETLRYWRSLLGIDGILLCHMDALMAAKSSPARNAILVRIDLVDVSLVVSNGSHHLKSQVDKVINGVLFEKPSYPWVHWSIGSVNSNRIASRISTKNATVAVSLLGMMLPGTVSIFYGDEKGIVDCACDEHQDLAHVHNLAPMYWDKEDGTDDKFSSGGVLPWLPIADKPMETSLPGTIAGMAKLRSETTSIYMKAILKDNKVKINCDIRYSKDELIVLERWYPRRNTYAYVANFGNETRKKDLSSLYYGGHVVVGPKYRLNREVLFKELSIPPGEAFVIKLDK